MTDLTEQKPTLYLETTIISYLTSQPARDVIIVGHQASTRKWWEEERGKYRLFVSPFVVEEASQGDPSAAEKRLRVIEGIDSLDPTPELEALAEQLRAALDISRKARLDAFHLALAVLYQLDYVLTWNCSHLANAESSRRLAAFARDNDLWLPIVCTPDEMIQLDEVQ